jgi:LacI family transcriptional regulator
LTGTGNRGSGNHGRPTMKDVAQTAGVGLKTVSRVVNGEPGVNSATADRVRDAITKLGFRRNDSARILRRGNTASIGLVLEDVGDPFYSGLTRAVEEVARRHDSLVFTGSSDEDPDRERELTLAFCARRVEGLIVVPAGDDHEYLVPELAAGIAAVFVDRPAGNIKADAVLADNAGGTREGVEHLLGQGHRRIAFLGDSPQIFTAKERLRGYREAVTAAGHEVDEELVAMFPPRAETIRRTLDRLLSGDRPATALFTGNSRVTVAVLRELARRPERPALVGFDDFELADLLTPGVTVVAQDPTGLGRTAAELLFQRLEGDKGPARRVELSTRLVPRGSGEVKP